MARTIIDIDDEKLARAQRALRTSTKRETVNAALELAAAVEADRRAGLLDSFRQLLDPLDTDIIEQGEGAAPAGRAALTSSPTPPRLPRYARVGALDQAWVSLGRL